MINWFGRSQREAIFTPHSYQMPDRRIIANSKESATVARFEQNSLRGFLGSSGIAMKSLLITLVVTAEFIGCYSAVAETSVAFDPTLGKSDFAAGIRTGLSGSNPTWKLHTINDQYSGADGVNLNDIDGDGDLDVVSAFEQGDRVELFLNPGNSAIVKRWPSTNVLGGLSITDMEESIMADLNGDGRIDSIVTACEGSQKNMAIHWLDMHSRPEDPDSWDGTKLLPEKRKLYMTVRVAQIDGKDGNDIVVGTKTKGSNDGRIFWFRAPQDPGRSNVHEWKRFSIGDAKRALIVEVEDMDNDGDMDVLFSDNDVVGWYDNPGPHGVQKQWPLHVLARGLKPRMLALCDLDQDGMRDVVTTANKQDDPSVVGVWIRRGSADGGSWESYPIAIESGLPYGGDSENMSYSKAVECADFNLDGRMDLVFVARGKGVGAYWLSYQGDKLQTEKKWDFHPISENLGDMKFDNIQVVDLDRDGDLDVVTTEENSGSNSNGLGVIWFENLD